MKQNLFEKFEEISCFNKADLRLVFEGSEDALNERIKRAIRNKIIIQLKKGLYTTNIYWLKEPDKTAFIEFVASKLRYPSYISLEYVLAINNLLTEATYPITSITIKSNRIYQNRLGNFNYSSIKRELFIGYQEKRYAKNSYYIASPAKAIFDWFYLKKNIRINKNEIIEELRINWENLSYEDFLEFEKYVKLSGSNKMLKINNILKKELYAN